MFQNETQPETHLERSTPLRLQSTSLDAEVQRKRMLIALGILLVALVAVVLKDWDFWFPSGDEVQQEATVRSRPRSPVAAPTVTPSAPAPARKSTKSSAPTPTAPAADQAPFQTTERAALPPLQVEVVAGNSHISIPAKSNAIHLDVDSGQTSSVASAATPAPSGLVSAGDRVQLSPQTAQQSSPPP